MAVYEETCALFNEYVNVVSAAIYLLNHTDNRVHIWIHTSNYAEKQYACWHIFVQSLIEDVDNICKTCKNVVTIIPHDYHVAQ